MWRPLFHRKQDWRAEGLSGLERLCAADGCGLMEKESDEMGGWPKEQPWQANSLALTGNIQTIKFHLFSSKGELNSQKWTISDSFCESEMNTMCCKGKVSKSYKISSVHKRGLCTVLVLVDTINRLYFILFYELISG